MKHPQTLAVELNKVFPNAKLKNIADFACCAFVTMWCLGIEPDDEEAIFTVQRAIDAKALDTDCTVKWLEFGSWLTGRSLKVEFADIISIKSIKERTPVKYSYNGKSRWVGVENGRVAFNPLKSSVCVSKGKAVTSRKLSIKK